MCRPQTAKSLFMSVWEFVSFDLFCIALGWAGGVQWAPANGGVTPLNYQTTVLPYPMPFREAASEAAARRGNTRFHHPRLWPLPFPQWPSLTSFSPWTASLGGSLADCRGFHLSGTGWLGRPHLSRLSRTPMSSSAPGSGSQWSALQLSVCLTRLRSGRWGRKVLVG